MFQRVLDTFEILDSAYASGKAVQDLFASKGFGDIVEVQQLNGPKGTTDFVRIIIKGSNGKLSGGTAPTLGVTGRLGGLGARPEMIGFVSDGDGALTAIAVALKLCDMQKKGDVLPGDVIVTTHVCPNAPTSPHFPTPFMGSPVEMGTINTLEVEMDVDNRSGERHIASLCQVEWLAATAGQHRGDDHHHEGYGGDMSAETLHFVNSGL